MTQALVVGGGAAGLAAALELQRRGVEVRLIEATPRVGGVVQTEHREGYLFERGPNTMQGKPTLRPFLEANALEPLLVPASPASRRRWLWHDGRLEAVPMDPLSFLRTRLLTGRGKLRLLREPFVARGDASRESVDEFVRRRLGDEALENLVAPFLTGVYAGDETKLGAAAVFGALVDLEREHGSIVRGALRRALGRRDRPRPLRGSFSTSEGLGGLVTRLAARLGERVATSTRAVALGRDSRGFRVELEAGEPLRAERVVLALPASECAALVASLEPEVAEALRSIVYAPVASVSVGVRRADTREPIAGFGFLVPKRGGLDLLGCLFMSQLYPGRAPEAHELLTGFLGGSRSPGSVDEADDEIFARMARDLERTHGLRGEPQRLGLTRWPRAIAQPGPLHRATVAFVRERIARRRGLAIAGSFLDGVALADTLVCGAAAARSVLEEPASAS